MMGAGALAGLMGALGFQYLAHLAPCEMCHWQRWPYIAAAVIGLLGTFVWKKDARVISVIIVLMVVCGIAAAYQWTMLSGWQPRLLAVAIVGLVVVPFWKKDLRLLAVAVTALVALSGLIGAYQTGMQYHLFPGPQACTADHPYVIGSSAPAPAVRCDIPTWFLFGLAMPAYNAIFAFLIAGTGAFLLRRNHAA